MIGEIEALRRSLVAWDREKLHDVRLQLASRSDGSLPMPHSAPQLVQLETSREECLQLDDIDSAAGDIGTTGLLDQSAIPERCAIPGGDCR